MSLIDKRFRDNKKQYILQCLIATGALILVLYFVDYFARTSVVASIGATAFILFTMPHTNRSKPRFILGGYLAGILSGITGALMIQLISGMPITLAAGVAVGIAMFIMVVFNVEHPPAAAVAFGVALDGFDLYSYILLYGVVFALYFIVYLNRKWFIDLL